MGKIYPLIMVAVIAAAIYTELDDREQCLDVCNDSYAECKKHCKTHTCVLRCARDSITCKKACKK